MRNRRLGRQLASLIRLRGGLRMKSFKKVSFRCFTGWRCFLRFRSPLGPMILIRPLSFMSLLSSLIPLRQFSYPNFRCSPSSPHSPHSPHSPVSPHSLYSPHSPHSQSSEPSKSSQSSPSPTAPNSPPQSSPTQPTKSTPVNSAAASRTPPARSS